MDTRPTTSQNDALHGSAALGFRRTCRADSLQEPRIHQYFENSPPSTQQHEGFIHGDACQPIGEARLCLKVVEMKESLVKALLHHIFGIRPSVGYPLRHGKNAPLATKNQFIEGVP